MATVYSLVCWGGSLGKSVTVSSSTDYVTLTNHGLRNGKGVQFVSGTLPTVAGTALALATTYYAKYISSSAFELYHDSGLTSKIDFTSAGESLVLRGQYYQSLTDKSRWATGSVERIYDSLASYNSGRSGASSFDVEVCELAEAIDDWSTPVISIPAASVVITSSIAGVRTEAFHNGVIGAGYVVNKARTSSGVVLTANSWRTTFDGFSARFNGGGTYNGAAIKLSGPASVASRMIVYGENVTGETGFNGAEFVNIDRCLCYNLGGSAVYVARYATGFSVTNCTFVFCKYGIYTNYTTSILGWFYNNLAIASTVANWYPSTSPGGVYAAIGNASSDGTGWATSGSIVNVATTDFADFSNKDYRPASSASPQVDAGVLYYGYSTTDAADAEVPNYNNGGAEAVDIGCYEYDHGYGNHPASTIVTFLGVVSGSEIHVYDSEDNELVGTESCTANQSLTWGIPSNPNVKITIIKRGLRWMKFTYLSEEGPQTIPIFPQPDLGYNNPA